MTRFMLFAVALTVAMAQVATAELISNGGFESTNGQTYKGGIGSYFTPDDLYPVDFFTNWTASKVGPGYPGTVVGGYRGAVKVYGVTGNDAVWLEACGSGKATISQTINVGADGLYKLSIDAESPNTYPGGGAASIVVTIDGTSLTFGLLGNSFTPASNSNAFVKYTSDDFHIASGVHTLAITGFSRDTGWRASAIDNVSIVSVPEPSTIALLTGALIGLLAYAWRKRKN